MTLPDMLQKLADRYLDTLNEKQADSLARWQGDERARLSRTLGLSDFIASSLEHDESLLPWLKEHVGEAERNEGYRETLEEILALQADENGAMRELRRFRRREMVWLAWKDFNGEIALESGLNHLSELAEAMIIESYHWLYADCCKQWGTPTNAMGEPQPMLILGMGKLGGGELNFSSDIDLIFTYPENGETQGARRSIANPQFFTRLGQRLIKLLDQQTFDGFCYRVDMRLRPFGDSGPLVMSFAALEDYYQEQGRDWERYAMIKARVMGREQFECYQELRQLLRPFVFRRYIDFSAVQSLRRMKAMISSEVRRRGLHDNIKLGPGGIREIEFIAQSFQLIRGGREPSLRKRGLLETLQAVGDLGLLPEGDVVGLKNAYLFLRRMENLLQAIADKQTQTLPDTERDQARLHIAMGYDSWDGMMAARQQHMDIVHDVFDSLIGDDEQETESDVPPACQELWDMASRDPEILASIFTDTGVSCPEAMAARLSYFKKELAKRTLGPRGREVLNRLMPKLLAKVVEPGLSCPEELLGRLTHLIVRIASRTTYMELLDEHPAAIAQLVRLCAASPMVAEKLSTYPVLLDELLDPRELYNPLPLDQYKTELREFLARIPEEDMEQQMEALRQFKQIQLLKIAAADIAGVLPLMKVSDHLTYLAEAIIDAAVGQAWVQTAAKYGEPSHLSGRDGRGFAVIGYGKVGGWELGYGSDLDVVFIHDCPDNVYTNGKKEIDGRQFYLRLAQRVVHLFSTRTASGVLYELDTRLRPSGTSGMLVTTLESFREYQEQEAWTWEHQALVRARMVYGDPQLADGFEKVRHEILCAERDTEKLRKEVAEMREKMREHLGSKTAGVFKIKQDRGGITDIEFIAQYLVLNHSGKEPKLTRWSDNVRIFEDCANYGIVEEGQAIALRDTYVTLRDKMHRLALAGNDAEVPDSTLVDERNVVSEAWDNWLAGEQSTE